MERKARRQLVVLAALLVLLVAAWSWSLRPRVETGSQSVRPRVPAGRVAARAADPGTVEDVRLEVLDADRPEPASAGRNPFRFKPPPPPPPAPPKPVGPLAGSPDAAGPPPPAPIPLKFIGIVDPTTQPKLAVLSDSRGVYYGREGDVIEGRYRIVRIGPESIVMIYVDGRGQQTIRLSGS
jgi:hypothetical protein